MTHEPSDPIDPKRYADDAYAYEPAPPPPAPPRRSTAAVGPWLAGGLAVLLVALVWVAMDMPGVPQPTPGPSASPGASVEPSAVASATLVPSPTFVYPTPSPLPTFMAYVVTGGDSLTSIARQFETTPRSIAWWNRVAYPSLDPQSEDYDPNTIQPGWTLVLIPGLEFDETTLPTPTPAPSNSPSPAPTATPEPTGPAVVITNGTRGTNKIALTLDMGGRLDPAVDIVQWLIDHQIHATLFPTGRAGTATDEGKRALLLAAQHPELFTFGNHSWSHPNFTTLRGAEMQEQITSAEDAIVELTGWTTKPWFRPPFGAWTAPVRTAVGEAGWHYLVMWDVDTIDWRPESDGGPTAQDIVDKVVSKGQGGSIVLMHLGGWNTLEALPGLMDGLKAKGLQPVTLQEMFGL